MKKFALGVLAAVAMTGSAFAADMAPRYTKAPPPAPVAVYSWTGCYIGGNVGGGWERTSQTQTAKIDRVTGANFRWLPSLISDPATAATSSAAARSVATTSSPTTG